MESDINSLNETLNEFETSTYTLLGYMKSICEYIKLAVIYGYIGSHMYIYILFSPGITSCRWTCTMRSCSMRR